MEKSKLKSNPHISIYITGKTNIDEYTIKLCNELLVATTIKNKKTRRLIVEELSYIINKLQLIKIPTKGLAIFCSKNTFRCVTTDKPIMLTLYRVDNTFFTQPLSIYNDV